MSTDTIILSSILGGILVLTPVVFYGWRNYLRIKYRKISQDKVLATIFTIGGLPIHCLCSINGYQVVLPDKVVKRLRKQHKELSKGKDKTDLKKLPSTLLWSEEAKIHDLWPLDKPMSIQTIIARFFYKYPNPNPLNPNLDLVPVNTDAMVAAIANENSTGAMLGGLRADSRDGKDIEKSLARVEDFNKRVLIALIIVLVAAAGAIVMSYMSQSSVSEINDSMLGIKDALGIK